MGAILTNRWFHTLILLGLLTGAVGMRMHDYKWVQGLRFLAFDTYNRIHPRPPTDQVVVVDIDEASMTHEELGQWPWSRLVVAKLVSQLKAMGAKAVAFDVVFPEADRTSPGSVLKRLPALQQDEKVAGILKDLPDNDEMLAAAIRDAGNVSMGLVCTQSTGGAKREPVLTQPILTKGEAARLSASVAMMPGVTTTIPVLSQAAAGNGSFCVEPEVDGLIRRVPLLFSYRGAAANAAALYPSLALEALRTSEGAKTVVKIRALKPDETGPLDPPLRMNVGRYNIPMDWDGRFLVYFSPARQKDYIPAWQVIEGKADPVRIKDKIVFVGTSAEGLKDVRSTPLDLYIPGVELHVNIVEQILTGKFLERPQLIEGLELMTIGGAGLLIILLVPFAGAVTMAVFTLALGVMIASASWYAFRTYGLLIDPVYPGLCLIALYALSALLSYVRAEAERVRVRQAFGLYISPDFMEELTRNPDKLRLGGETRELTVMFTDIRGFTGIAEGMPPASLIQLMNDFLTPMSDLVMSNRGTIDKYMGDAMMAFWNAPLDDPHHARHACAAALKMNTALDPINAMLKAQNRPLLKAGIGINTGPASVGNMGSRQRFAYSAIGDTVNLASRLEGQTKTYSASILIGQETQRHVRDFAALELDLIQVKGKTEPVRVFALLGDPEYAAPLAFQQWKTAHESMIAAYRSMNFAAAARLADEARELATGRLQDFYAIYKARIATLIDSPPAAGWNGVYVATSK